MEITYCGLFLTSIKLYNSWCPIIIESKFLFFMIILVVAIFDSHNLNDHEYIRPNVVPRNVIHFNVDDTWL